MKISVLTPTYNDSESIEETLKSLVEQTHEDWEWIVINDGSSDDTESRIKELIEKYEVADKCKYIWQENGDQLNAIINGVQYITGKYVFTLHSDDLLPEKEFFTKCIAEMEKNPEADGLFGDLLIIDTESKVTGRQVVKEYHVQRQTPPLMLLWLGRNLYSDVAFHKASVYKEAVMDNYLIWNMPLWIDLRNNHAKMLNYKSVPFPVLKYRVHGGNYINNELGKMNVINGELRTATQLMQHYTVPNYSFQYFKFRLMNKIMPNKEFIVKYKERETEDKYSVVAFIINKRYPQGVEDNIFLSSVLEFYKIKSDRKLEVSKIPSDVKVYYGKDVRLFNKKVLENTLEAFYMDFLGEMKKGFGEVIAADEEDEKKLNDILKFLCIGHIKVRRG